MRTDLFHRHHSNPSPAPEIQPCAPQGAAVVPVTPSVFAENVYADAEENCAKIMARKHKRVTEPKLLGQAIRESYMVNPLVLTLKKILHELSEEHGTRLGFGFSGPTGLVLTEQGFSVTTPSDAKEEDILIISPLPESLDVGPDGTCAMTRLHLDAQLTQFAKSPEEFAMAVMDKPLRPAQKDAKGARKKKLGPGKKPPHGLARMPVFGKLFK